jgi:hypothetical protein
MLSVFGEEGKLVKGMAMGISYYIWRMDSRGK